jgi:BirA family biotin operon repressor/biotin-[acetyl-CoA-carboxylase] ligase
LALTESNSLSAAAILDGLGTQFVGRELAYWPEIGSTNDEARRLAGEGAPEGMLVVADYQSRGRGRLDRGWVAPPGSSLLMSIVFRPELAPHQLQRLTMSCGLAAVGAIEEQTGLRADLKWPNDVVIGGAKAGGILTEVGLAGAQVEFAVVGMGLNVNLDPGLLPADLPMPATSLCHELGTEVPRLPLLRSLLQQVEARYLALKAGQSPHMEWANRLVTLGKPVTVSATGLELDGTAEGVDADGALLVRLASGRLERVLAGDVSVRG